MAHRCPLTPRRALGLLLTALQQVELVATKLPLSNHQSCLQQCQEPNMGELVGAITFLWAGHWEMWPQQSHYLTWRGILLLPGSRPSTCPEISHSTLRTRCHYHPHSMGRTEAQRAQQQAGPQA